MNFDQPEAQLFFGLKNKCCCTKCKRQKGFSAFRQSTSQSGTAVRRLYTMVREAPAEVAKVAREKLQRWGFNPARPCCIHSLMDVDKLLVRLPGWDEVFPCLDYRDRMHGIFIFLHHMIMDVLNVIPLSAPQKRVLDERPAS